MTQRRVLVVGSANIDLVTRVPRSPKPGESLIGNSFSTVTGGKGANQAVAAARLGAQTHFIGCVGADAFGAQQRASLEEAGVNLDCFKVHPTEPTGTAVILVAQEGQNSIVVTPSANYGLRPEDIEAQEALFRAADVVLLQLEIPLETVEAALDMARRCETFSMVDAGPAQALAPELIQKADLISPNETEAEALTGIVVDSSASAREAAQALQAMGVEHVVMKMGAQGSFYLGEAKESFLPAFPVQAVDTTAAGDAFTAALAVCWRDCSLEESLAFANATGALATTIAGAQPSMPQRAMVEAFLAAQP